VPRTSSGGLTRVSPHLVAPTTMWEIVSNSVGNGSEQCTVRPGQSGFVGSPPPTKPTNQPTKGCRHNCTCRVDKMLIERSLRVRVGGSHRSGDIRHC